MSADAISQRLTIGEFAAATQLSPKALRLYDEQCILRPAMVDANNGYRYYRRDQVAAGRLIRILREMELPLTQVTQVINANRADAALLLRECSLEVERQYARRKRAFQSALMLLGRQFPADTPEVGQRERSATLVAVKVFTADRTLLFARFQSEVNVAMGSITKLGCGVVGEAMCLLIDPISEDEGRFELLLPVKSDSPQSALQIRQLPKASCAVWTTEALDTSALDLAAALDGLFDWLDRRGYRAVESPSLVFHARDGRYVAEVSWPYESLR